METRNKREKAISRLRGGKTRGKKVDGAVLVVGAILFCK
jgi:hypothetical protein